MGIKGLWKEVQPVCTPSHISQFKGQKVAIDGYCWLHRAAIASVIPLCTGEPCDRFLHYFMQRVESMIRFGVTPVVIFDGQSMPMKGGTDAARKERRAAARQEGLALLAAGRKEEASSVLEKSIEITSEIAYAIISLMKRRNIECIVAPYEADAQLAFLCREGHVQAVFSEDSDLIVYNCATLIAKLDAHGNCDVLRTRDLKQLPAIGVLNYDLFVKVCIISGCDYLQSLSGVGIKTATKVVAQSRTIEAIIAAFSSQGFPARELQLYEEGLHRAYYCFAHHLVYDPKTEQVVPFTPLPDGVPLREDILGAVPDNELAKAMCGMASVDPTTLKAYVGRHEDSVKLYMKRIQGGQKTLSESGMNVTLTKRQPTSGSSVNKLTGKVTAVRTLDTNTGWRSRPGKNNGTIEVVVMKSKYFEEVANEDHEGTAVEDSCLEDVQGSDDDSLCDEMFLTADERIEEAPPSVQVDSQVVEESQSTTTSPSMRDVLCPHGYLQCGKVHSIFIKCFIGNPSWTKGTSQDETALSPVSTAAWQKVNGRKRGREEHRNSSTQGLYDVTPPKPEKSNDDDADRNEDDEKELDELFAPNALGKRRPTTIRGPPSHATDRGMGLVELALKRKEPQQVARTPRQGLSSKEKNPFANFARKTS